MSLTGTGVGDTSLGTTLVSLTDGTSIEALESGPVDTGWSFDLFPASRAKSPLGFFIRNMILN